MHTKLHFAIALTLVLAPSLIIPTVRSSLSLFFKEKKFRAARGPDCTRSSALASSR